MFYVRKYYVCTYVEYTNLVLMESRFVRKRTRPYCRTALQGGGGGGRAAESQTSQRNNAGPIPDLALCVVANAPSWLALAGRQVKRYVVHSCMQTRMGDIVLLWSATSSYTSCASLTHMYMRLRYTQAQYRQRNGAPHNVLPFYVIIQ